MDLAAFKASLANKAPPRGAGRALKALWHLANGDWDKAHRLAQEQADKDGAWVHAHLHRSRGEHGNAGGWYARAGKAASKAPLDREWAEIVSALLER